MQKAAHLTDGQVARFRNRTLEAAELLSVDEHLEVCATCRARLEHGERASVQIAGLRTRLLQHLEYPQILAGAEGRGDSAVREHLAECPSCQAEVEDLRSFQKERQDASRKVVVMPAPNSRRRRPAWAAIAAGLILAGGLTFFALHRETPAPATAIVAQAPPPAEPALAPDQQAAIQLALSSHHLERAGVLDRLISKRGVLLGAPGDVKSFAINAPMGTVVLNDRPIFRWEEVAGAGRYVVAVFDDRFQKVIESPDLTTTEWTPEQPLARGRIYNWQVTAHVGRRTMRAPVPPAPEARFQVAEMDESVQVENVRRDHPGNHLLLAVVLARTGALDEASRELDALAATDPATAQSLSESLQSIRAR